MMKLIRKLLVVRYQNRPLTVIEEDGKIVSFSISEEEESILGNIYIAQVQNIVKNIQAAFLTFADGKIGYYSLEENKNPIFMIFFIFEISLLRRHSLIFIYL